MMRIAIHIIFISSQILLGRLHLKTLEKDLFQNVHLFVCMCACVIPFVRDLITLLVYYTPNVLRNLSTHLPARRAIGEQKGN